MPPLYRLSPGTRFRLAEMPEITGTLIEAGPGPGPRALVRLDRPVKDVEFEAPDGSVRSFRARAVQTTSWAATTVVVAIPAVDPSEEIEMSKSPKTKKAPKAEAAKAKAPRAGKAKASGNPSCLDAAAQVLAGAREPLTTRQLIEQMAAQKLWASPNGQTPAATLYSAILREIQKKGKESRFVKADRGTFALAGAPARASTAKGEPGTKKSKPAKGKPGKAKAARKPAPAEGEPGPEAVAELFQL